MTPNTRQQYLHNEILSADPIQLVRILYKGALKCIAEASALLRAGDIGGRSREAMKAHAILSELAQSLDHARGGELSRNLAALYDYVQRRLLDANFQQRDEPFAEAESLLRTLLEGWEQCQIVADSAHAPSPEEGYGEDFDLMAGESYESFSLAG